MPRKYHWPLLILGKIICFFFFFFYRGTKKISTVKRKNKQLWIVCDTEPWFLTVTWFVSCLLLPAASHRDISASHLVEPRHPQRCPSARACSKHGTGTALLFCCLGTASWPRHSSCGQLALHGAYTGLCASPHAWAELAVKEGRGPTACGQAALRRCWAQRGRGPRKGHFLCLFRD